MSANNNIRQRHHNSCVWAKTRNHIQHDFKAIYANEYSHASAHPTFSWFSQHLWPLRGRKQTIIFPFSKFARQTTNSRQNSMRNYFNFRSVRNLCSRIFITLEHKLGGAFKSCFRTCSIQSSDGYTWVTFQAVAHTSTYTPHTHGSSTIE